MLGDDSLAWLKNASTRPSPSHVTKLLLAKHSSLLGVNRLGELRKLQRLDYVQDTACHCVVWLAGGLMFARIVHSWYKESG